MDLIEYFRGHTGKLFYETGNKTPDEEKGIYENSQANNMLQKEVSSLRKTKNLG